MIKDNVLYFGYGDIAVGGTFNGVITFREFKPPQIIGKHIDENSIVWLSDLIIINVELFNIKELAQLEYKEDKKIIINNYILDFSNFNKESLNVVIRQVKQTLQLYYIALAC